MANGAGYNSHPTDCDKYVQCFFDQESLVAAFYRSCPWGQHWNQEILSCQQPQHAKCINGALCHKQTQFTANANFVNDIIIGDEFADSKDLFIVCFRFIFLLQMGFLHLACITL